MSNRSEHNRDDTFTTLAQISLFAALALVLSYIETMIPLPIAIPGIKLGLANAAVLIALFVLDTKSAMKVAFVKVIAAGFLFGSPMMLAYSAAGTVLALAGMISLKHISGIGLVPVSMVAAILHNVGQLAVAAMVLATPLVFLNLPLLALAACVTGAVVGMVANAVLSVLSASKDKVRTVDKNAFEIKPGQHVSIIGSNGSGKTTFALELARSGKDIAVVLQDPDSQIIAEVVRDDVAFGLENKGIEPMLMNAQIDIALCDVKLTEYASSFVNELSGGQKQRCAIGGVAVMKPQTVIFDESTSMLDPQARDGFKVIVDNLCDQGISVITITQSMDEAFESDRVVVLSGNHILADATPADLLRQHVLLKACGLKLPIIASLSLRLQEEGIAVPLTNKAEELENALWRLSATI